MRQPTLRPRSTLRGPGFQLRSFRAGRSVIMWRAFLSHGEKGHTSDPSPGMGHTVYRDEFGCEAGALGMSIERIPGEKTARRRTPMKQKIIGGSRAMIVSTLSGLMVFLLPIGLAFGNDAGHIVTGQTQQ